MTKNMRRALSVKQPWASMIMSGMKTIECRSKPTRALNETIYIYASTTVDPATARVALKRLDMDADRFHGLPRGVILGTAKIRESKPYRQAYGWFLYDVRVFKHPKRLPIGVRPTQTWFYLSTD